jgi:peptidoglycan-associated lipoprotein
MKRLPVLLVSGLAVAALAACSKKPPETTPPPVAANADSVAQAERAKADSIERARAEAARRAQEEADRAAARRVADSLAAMGKMTDAVKALLGTMIHFDFDKANILAGDAAVLDQKVAILQTNPALRIRINGHCDERGSDEYNLALGNRRAIAAKQYVANHGIDAGRVETASYGKERPLDPGHDEAAWAKNRRDEFEILAGGDNLKQP